MHRVSNMPEYQAWYDMKHRCLNPNNTRYANYGGRGIVVCKEWLNSFENFLEDMGPRPSRRSLDRIDNNGNYEPGNCRWATDKQQAYNKRTNNQNTNKTHCINGHELSGDNLQVTLTGERVGKRNCRTCRNKSAQESKRRVAQGAS